jgi:hypothetical protein
MENIFIADLNNPVHAEAVVYLLNEYAKDDMGVGSELPEYVKHNLVPELKKRQGIYAVIAFVHEAPAGLAICMEGFSTFACKPLLNVHDIVVAPQFRGREYQSAYWQKRRKLLKILVAANSLLKFWKEIRLLRPPIDRLALTDMNSTLSSEKSCFGRKK